MISSAKSAFLIALTMVIYALGILFQNGGKIVFPFPIYPLAFTMFAVIHYLNNKSSLNFLLIGSGIFLSLSGLFIWEIFLNTDQLYSLMDSATTDLLFLMGKLLLFIWMIISIYGIRIKQWRWLALLIVTPLFITALAFDHRGLESLSYIAGSVALIFTKSEKNDQAAWLLLSFFAVSEWFTLYNNIF
jgi:hypothetical protein